MAFDAKYLQDFWLGQATVDDFDSAKAENRRLQPIHAALIECVHALRGHNYHDEDCADATEKFKPCEMCECGASVVEDALAKLEAALEGRG